jgi:hypothetical protein
MHSEGVADVRADLEEYWLSGADLGEETHCENHCEKS